MTYVSKPSLKQCRVVAKRLIEEHEFLKDDEGDGDNSWKWFIYYRCQNVNKPEPGGKRLEEGPTKKKLKLASDRAKHSFAPVLAEDAVSYERNLDLLKQEQDKPRPRIEVLKDLMGRTFTNRFDALINSSDPVTASEHVVEFPLLKKPAYAAQEFCMLIQRDDIRETFEDNILDWSKAIIHYCKDTQIKSSSLQMECVDFSDDIGQESCVLMALRCLSLLLVPMKTKKLDKDIPFLLKVVPRGTPPSEATMKSNNQPHLVKLQNEDDSEGLSQYFIAVEQKLMMECSTLIAALFFGMVAHYIFNLLQEKVFQYPSNDKCGKHSPSYITHISGISRVHTKLNETSEMEYSEAAAAVLEL